MMQDFSRANDLYNLICAEGEAAIDEFIATRKSEELFLDFKRSSDNGAGVRLSQTDRDNLAKAISGFGNSAGGVLAWGVDCSQAPDGADVARMKVPIVDPHRFTSWLNAAVSGCTIPPHNGVLNTPISDASGASGFAVTYIPQSNHAPHQVIRRLQYYIRAGSDFVPTPHQVLAGLFGRRPQPHIYAMYNVTPIEVHGMHLRCQVGIVLRNNGPGVAEDLFLTAMMHSLPGNNCTCAFHPPDLQQWDVTTSWARHISVISKRDIRLPPDAQVELLGIEATFAPPFEQRFEIRGTVGGASAVPFPFDLNASAEQVQTAYNACLQRYQEGTLEQETQDLVSRLMGRKQ